MRDNAFGSLVACAFILAVWTGLDEGRAQSSDKAAAVTSTLFSPEGTPVRPTINLHIKEADGATLKTDSKKGKIDPSKVQPPGLLAAPKSAPEPRPTKDDETKVLLRAFDRLHRLTRGRNADGYEKGYEKGSDSTKTKGENDDAALNAAACKAAAAANKPLPLFCRARPSQIDRTVIDRMDADRVEQLRGGPAGFNPNKP